RERAMRAFRLWPPAHPVAVGPSAVARAHGRPSVAVIPFQLRTDDARFAFIGDGLADETIAALSRVADFFVTSRLSSMAFRRAPLGARAIGEMLGVQYVLSGSVQTAEARALLMAELADTRDGSIVWSERFEGDFADVLAMQGELARKVVQSVTRVMRSPWRSTDSSPPGAGMTSIPPKCALRRPWRPTRTSRSPGCIARSRTPGAGVGLKRCSAPTRRCHSRRSIR